MLSQLDDVKHAVTRASLANLGLIAEDGAARWVSGYLCLFDDFEFKG